MVLVYCLLLPALVGLLTLLVLVVGGLGTSPGGYLQLILFEFAEVLGLELEFLEGYSKLVYILGLLLVFLLFNCLELLLLLLLSLLLVHLVNDQLVNLVGYYRSVVAIQLV